MVKARKAKMLEMTLLLLHQMKHLDIRKAERLTARLEMQELLRQKIKKEREKFPVKKRERKEIKGKSFK